MTTFKEGGFLSQGKRMKTVLYIKDNNLFSHIKILPKAQYQTVLQTNIKFNTVE